MILIAVDPHKSSHTALPVDPAGRELGQLRVEARAHRLRTTGGHGHRPGARAKSWVGRSWAGCITSTSVSPRDIRADDIFW